MTPLVAIVGRPNVGKSTLFNRLIRARRAIVQDDPGVTRDRHYGSARIDDREIELIDTGGFVPGASGIDAQISAQAQIAVDEADLILLVMDAREGVMPADRELVQRLRRIGKPVLHVANKVDGPKQEALTAEFYELGVDQVFGVSSEHALGFEPLLDAVLELLPSAPTTTSEEEGDPIRVALLGRPNAGKSSLFNALLGTERVIVSAEPGTTRDPVDVRLSTEDDGDFVLVDTAGIRRKKGKSTTMERFAIVRAMRTISSAQVACLVVDADAGPTEQDAKLANLTQEAGRGMVLVLTKSDLLGRKEAARKELMGKVQDELGFADYAPSLMVSSVTGRGLKRLLPTVRRVYDSCSQRITTSELNRFLEQAVTDHAPASFRGRQVRLYYITQATVRPPTFVLSTNAPQGVQRSYRRYLANRLRERYTFEGAPLRLFVRGKKDRRK